MPTKKASCDRVQRAVAGPTPEDIVESIRAEYDLPRPRRRETKSTDAAHASSTSKPAEVKS